jgi:hypothetical protein
MQPISEIHSQSVPLICIHEPQRDILEAARAFSVRLSCLHELSQLEEVVSLTRQNDVALLWSLWIHTMLISVTFTRLLIARF